MNQVLYAMQFKGTAAPKAGATGVIAASTRATSCTLSSIITSNGVTGALQSTQDGHASFESEVTLTGETSFREAGTIRFGDGNHCLHFSTIGIPAGLLTDSAHLGLLALSARSCFRQLAVCTMVGRCGRWRNSRNSRLPTPVEVPEYEVAALGV